MYIVIYVMFSYGVFYEGKPWCFIILIMFYVRFSLILEDIFTAATIAINEID